MSETEVLLGILVREATAINLAVRAIAYIMTIQLGVLVGISITAIGILRK